MLGLAPHIHIACFDDRVVVLDIVADRYRLLTGRKARLLIALARNQVATDDAAARALVTERILVAGGRTHFHAGLAPPECGALERDDPHTVKLRWPELMFDAAQIAMRLRITSLDKLHRWVRAKRDLTTDLQETDLIAYAHAFERTRMFVPFRRNCLRDASLFAHLLARRGVACELVIGVRLDPFGAHSWVQAGNLVLTGKLASARELTPILVL